MTERPRISVLIGAWNNVSTLRRAIDSILSQTVEQFELIVVDDGSTDGTLTVARSTGDPRVRELALPHLGISRSLNAGLDEARADIVAFQDADDWSLPRRLEKQLALLDARPDVAVIGCRMDEVDGAGRLLRPRFGRHGPATGDVTEGLMLHNPIPNTSAAARRAALLEVGGYDARYRYAMEYDLWLRVAKRHRIWNLDEVLAVRLMGSTNVAATHDRDQVAESVMLKLRAMRRRRSPRGARGLVHPILSWAMPLPAKRVLRRARGMAP